MRRSRLVAASMAIFLPPCIRGRQPTHLAFAHSAPIYPDAQVDTQDRDGASRSTVRYRARVAYDGTGFNGWQTQSKGRTVQGELEAVLSRRFNRTVRVVGAGRTDAGVHARGQALHFDLYKGEVEGRENELKLQRSMNSMLRRDTRVWNVSRAPPPVVKSRDDGDGTTVTHKWHVIYEAEKKLYSYRISTAPALDPIQRFTRAHVYDSIDTVRLRSVLRHYEGTHCFRAFAGAIEQNERRSGKKLGTVRTVYRAELVDEGDGNFRIDFLLRGALYKMVRNMVGTALEVCKGNMEEEALLELLHHTGNFDDGGVKEQEIEKGETTLRYTRAKRSDNKCKPAAPEGLTLERVFFTDGF